MFLKALQKNDPNAASPTDHFEYIFISPMPAARRSPPVIEQENKMLEKYVAEASQSLSAWAEKTIAGLLAEGVPLEAITSQYYYDDQFRCTNGFTRCTCL